jgi:nitrate/nitrite transport system ATP-binding protein
MEIQNELNNTVIMITHDVDEAVLLSDRIVMMTNGPEATIGEILQVNLERPRSRLSLAKDNEYNRLRSEVLTFLYEKQRKIESISENKVALKTTTKRQITN